MNGHVTLLGAEDVKSASWRFREAAEQMDRATANLAESLAQMQRTVEMSLPLIERLAAALERVETLRERGEG